MSTNDVIAVCIHSTVDGSNIMNAYCGGFDNQQFGTNHRIWHRYNNAGSVTQASLASSAVDGAANDVINFQVVGTVLTLTIGADVITYDSGTDPIQETTGNVAVRLNRTASGSTRLAGSWDSGSVGGAPPPPDTQIWTSYRL